MAEFELGGGTFEADPEWMHTCAKEIIQKLGIEYSVWDVYEIVKILKKYEHTR